MKKINYDVGILNKNYSLIRGVIMLGVILICLVIFFFYQNDDALIEISKVMISFLSIIFGFFMINLVH